jgi:signal transduction histidine kinase
MNRARIGTVKNSVAVTGVRWWSVAGAAAAGGWLAVAGIYIAVAALDLRLHAIGRGDLADGAAEVAVYSLPIFSAASVGAVLGVLRPRHPAGWLFLALAIALAGSGLADLYAAYGAMARPGALPAAGFAAVVGDKVFIVWLLLLTLILLLTPAGRFASARWRWAGIIAITSATVAFALALIGAYEGPHASEGLVQNPIEVEAWQGPLRAMRVCAIVALHVVLISAIVSLAVRFFTARSTEGKRLRWLALAAVPFPILVIGAFVAATMNNETMLFWFGAGFVAVIPVAAGVAVLQDGLYGVDRVLRRGLVYGLLSAVIVGAYAIVVVVAGEALGGMAGGSQIAAVMATLGAISVGLPARSRIQDWLDRAFNRREFDAVATMRRWRRDPAAHNTSVEQALRESTNDDALSVAYWIEDRERWVDEAGAVATPDAHGVTAARGDTPIAAISFDDNAIDRRTVEMLADEVMSELETVRLRAALALQLVEVRESRARIVEAQLAERRRIERNLHDGAQQRLLALAMHLRAAEVRGDAEGAFEVLHRGADELQQAVKELRDLANGLAPITLADEGLAAALEELAFRAPVPISVEASGERMGTKVEETAWYIACEAVANAVKHASPSALEIRACRENGYLRLVIEDDGSGGADPSGSGLRGIADRAETIGGHVTVRERPGTGTIVTADLPCGL